MSDLERQLGDMEADGKITAEDSEAIRDFRDFLAETPSGLTQTPKQAWPGMFPSHAAYRAWVMKWLPYLLGRTSGPSTPDEWHAHYSHIEGLL